MTAACLDTPITYTIDEANAILKLAIVARMMRRGYTLNSRDWDIPYLAGYSKDASFIYIDRDLKRWSYLGQTIDCTRFLLLHEHVEKALIDALHETQGDELAGLLRLMRMTHVDDQLYFHCHGVATACEIYSVRLQYGDHGVASYNQFMNTQIKRAEDERIRRVPRDLDLLPYLGDDPKDERLRAVIHARAM